ncbi:MAG TPA: AraC family transcriptional regulator, partial [Parafilimonas sp.]
MMQTLDILQAAHRNTIDSRMDLLELKEHQIPGSAHYVIRRYNAPQFANTEDKGMLVYHYSKSQPEENFFELRFCITGNKYCSEKNCLACKETSAAHCKSHDSFDVFSFHFSAN